jgi:glycosyltransferase involved in cell wall biosynthesis
MWNGQDVSVVLMTYAERDSIRGVIDGFFATGLVDEVVVIDNNAQEGTAEQVALTKARLVREPRQGYGHATRRGLLEARGELVVLAEPDGTFLPEDLMKLLVYSDECDVVFGTRTTRELIWHGANMGWPLRWGNWLVAKLLQVLFDGPSLSDCGCTLRLVRRSALDRLLPRFTVGGSHFLPEMVCLALLARLRLVEVPVNYRHRLGESKITGSRLTAARVGLNMVLLIVRYRVFGR